MELRSVCAAGEPGNASPRLLAGGEEAVQASSIDNLLENGQRRPEGEGEGLAEQFRGRWQLLSTSRKATLLTAVVALVLGSLFLGGVVSYWGTGGSSGGGVLSAFLISTHRREVHHKKPDPFGKIHHEGGFCLKASQLRSGADVEMWSCATKKHTSAHQYWRFVKSTGEIRNEHGMCLDSGGDKLHIWHCNKHNAAQRWKHFSGSFINEDNNEHCLRKVGDTDRVAISKCNLESDQQEWSLETSGDLEEIRHGAFGCLHSPEPKKAGSLVHVEMCLDHKRETMEKWEYIHSSGHIRIGEHLCLEAADPHNLGSEVKLATCNTLVKSQGWTYFKSGQIKTRAGKWCLSSADPHHNGGRISLWYCNRRYEHQKWSIASGHAHSGGAPYTPLPRGDVHEFYMYRAAKRGTMNKYPFGDINVANMDGAIWYLMNEVVTEYGSGMRCPRKFDISLIYRFKVKIKATSELFSKHMNFGTRFAYDMGMCMGRCFPENKCTCKKDCDEHYKTYGYVPGCNNFADKYPFPVDTPQTPHGIWYSLPLEGRCKHPTGSHNCTWSFEHAGVISLGELESVSDGKDQCCDGTCTDFWTELYSTERTSWRVERAMDVFKDKYPHLPRDVGKSWCDFSKDKWYKHDPFKKQDPWKSEKCRKG